MKRIAEWAVRHPVPVNVLMVLFLIIGVSSAFDLKRELFPRFEIDQVRVMVAIDGSSTPDQVDRNIIQVIQPRIQFIDGVKQVNSTARENSATLMVEVESGYDSKEVKDEIKDEVDAITTLPDNAEVPRVTLLKHFDRTIQIAVYGEGATDLQLREVAEFVKSDLKLKGIASRVFLKNSRAHQLSIYLPPATLEAKGLSVDQVAKQIRDYNIEIGAGEIKTSRSDITIKGEGRKISADKIRTIPIHFSNGEFLSLGDLVGYDGIKDAFVEEDVISLYNGQRAAFISVERSESDDIIELCDAVRAYAETVNLPYGLQVETGQDLSMMVRDRLTLILRNGFTGLLLVLLVLALFLDWQIAFWAATGIAFSLIGSMAILYFTGNSINMLTLFGFLITTGIIVDDAIVVGESYFHGREKGLTPYRAAKETISAISLPVFAMMSTSVVAFIPLLFVSGLMGKFISIIPTVVISALVLSLLESLFILPCHLAHHANGKRTLLMRAIELLLLPVVFCVERIHPYVDRGLKFSIERFLLPSMKWAVHNRYATTIIFASIFVMLLGLIPAGIVKMAIFPRPDADLHVARIEFDKGTPDWIAAEQMARVENALNETAQSVVNRGDIHPLKSVFTSLKNGNGEVLIEMVSSENGRKISGREFVDLWRKKIPPLESVFSVDFSSSGAGPPVAAIEVWLSSRNTEQMREAEKASMAFLQSIEHVVDAASSNRPGAPTLQVELKQEFYNLPITEKQLISTLDNHYRGIEVDSFYRGDSEVEVYTLAVPDSRTDIAQLKNLILPGGLRVGQVANLTLTREEAEVQRVNGELTTTLTAEVDLTAGANAVDIRDTFEKEFLSGLSAQFPDVRWRYSGESQEGSEAMDSLVRGYIPALLVIYLILASVFHSYVQPLIIMLAIPFGFVGAIIGHLVMGFPFNLMSGFGIIALTGIAVNDSLVLIDFINRDIRSGSTVPDALVNGVSARFRPILLTSLTTIAGLGPILLETSFQAQFLIPMVTSITFGLLFTTLLIMILIPVGYVILLDVLSLNRRLFHGEQPLVEELVRNHRLEG